MTREWARTERVRGKGSALACMFCGRHPNITERCYSDGTISFTVCCPHCWNKHFRDHRETGIDITVCSNNIYSAIRDWNLVNGAYYRGYRKALNDIDRQLSEQFSKHVENWFLYGEVGKKQNYDFRRDYNGQFKKAGEKNNQEKERTKSDTFPC